MPPLSSIEILFLITCVFIVAGFVKGVIGLGLPSVSLALLTATLGLKPAMAILVMPAFFTNVWQGLSGTALKELLKRMWVFMAVACICTWIGGGILAGTNSSALSALLGILLVAYAMLSLTTRQLNLPARWEATAGPLAGAISGIFTGLTGSFVVPAVMYIRALDLPREKFIQAMGVTFTMATVSLGVSLGGHGLFNASLLYLSVYALVPAFVGMFIGRAVRNGINDALFQRIFFVALLVMGAYIVVRALYRIHL